MMPSRGRRVLLLGALFLVYVAAGKAAATPIGLTCWLGDCSGAMLVTPAIVCWWRARDRPRSWRHALEASLLAAVLVLACYVVFGPTAAGRRHYPAMYFVLPPLLWVSLRFGRREVTVALLLTSLLALLRTLP